MNARRSPILAVPVLLMGTAVVAHHSAAAVYDLDRVVTVEGVVTDVKWENPHTWVTVEEKDSTGRIVRWSFEGAVPNQLYRRGVTPSVLKPGVRITITAHPARDTSRHAGELREVTTADGRSIPASVQLPKR